MEFRFGSFVYQYDLVRQERKTLALTVTPELSITVKSPHRATKDRIDQFLQRKWFWLEKQLRFFKKYHRKTYQKEYLSGEGFLYLGKQYKLLVKHAKEDRVSMTKGLLFVQTSHDVHDAKYTRRLLDGWYKLKTEKVFRNRYAEISTMFEYKELPRLVIRNMQKRWGSFLEDDAIVLNPQLIHSPKACIDYVIAHELCHIRHKNHDKRFYKLLESKYPRWQKAKDRLEAIGVQTH